MEDCERQGDEQPRVSIIQNYRHCPTMTSGQQPISNANGVTASSPGLGGGTSTHPGKPIPTTSTRKAVVADPLVPHTRLRINTIDRRNRVAVGITWGRVTQGNLASTATLGYGRNPVGIHQGRQGWKTTVHNRFNHHGALRTAMGQVACARSDNAATGPGEIGHATSAVSGDQCAANRRSSLNSQRYGTAPLLNLSPK